MKRILRLFTVALLLLALLLPSMITTRAEITPPEERAVIFMEALQEGSWKRASRFCTDPSVLKSWTPPAVTRYMVFPLLRDIKVKDVKTEGDTAYVTLSVSAVDFDAPFMDDWPFRDDLISELSLSDEYATLEELYEEDLVWLIHGSGDFLQEADKHRKTVEIPYALKKTEDEWLIDLKATLEGWHASIAKVTPLSYGTLTYDYAQKRYYARDAMDSKGLSIPKDKDYSQWLRDIPVEEIFAAMHTPVWNVWLRLTADSEAEGVYGFTVDSNAAGSESRPVIYADFDFNITVKHWVMISGVRRATLEMYIPHEAGQPLDGYTVRYRQRFSIWSPMYYETESSFKLSNVPYDPGYPQDGVTFTANQFMRVGPAIDTRANHSGPADTLGVLMENEFDNDSYDICVMPGVPDGIGDLPILNKEYALFRLQGETRKTSGDYGVYDVTFGLSAPVDDVWVEAYEECNQCDEIDGCSLYGTESGLMEETLQSSFDIQVLVRIDGRTDAELNAFVKSLPLTATFSAEEWDFSYEQHGTTSRIGPRTTLPVDTSRMTLWEGTLDELMAKVREEAEE